MMERAEVLTLVMQSYSCAVTSGGGVKCWGYNYFGQVTHLVAISSVVDFSVGYSSHVPLMALMFAAWR